MPLRRIRDLSGPTRWVTLAIALAALWPGLVAARDGTASLLAPGTANRSYPLVAEEVPGLPSHPGSGHDGQQFYAIARSLPDLDQAATHLVEPVYRLRRILYPALARLVAPGGGLAMVRAFVLLGLVGVAIGAGTLSRLEGAPPWLPMTFAASPGVVAALTLSTPDALAIGVAFAGLAAASRGRARGATALFVVAVLTRETTLLACVAAAFSTGLTRRQRLMISAVPAAVITGWSLVLETRFGSGVSEGASRNLGVPFVGWFDAPYDPRSVAVGGLAVISALVVVSATDIDLSWRLFATGTLLMVTMLQPVVLTSWVNVSRVGLGMMPLAFWAISRRSQLATTAGSVDQLTRDGST